VIFFVGISKSKLDNSVSQVQLIFRVSQHSRGLRTHQLINSLVYYFGCGRIEERSNQDLVEFVVTKFSDIENSIIPFFTQYFLSLQAALIFRLGWDKTYKTKKEYCLRGTSPCACVSGCFYFSLPQGASLHLGKFQITVN
jgi:hypothetical protein